MRINPKAFVALIAVLLGACGGDSTGVNGDASGTYTLQSISGNPLPYTVGTSATTTLTFKSGSLTINMGASFSETTNFDQTDNSSGSPVVTSGTSTCVGTYSQRGNGFTFSEAASADPSCGFTYGGSWNGSNAFTVNYAPGAAALYTK
jgi:hypothetical protein